MWREWGLTWRNEGGGISLWLQHHDPLFRVEPSSDQACCLQSRGGGGVPPHPVRPEWGDHPPSHNFSRRGSPPSPSAGPGRGYPHQSSSTQNLCFVWSLRRNRLVVCGQGGKGGGGVPPTLFDLRGGITPPATIFSGGGHPPPLVPVRVGGTLPPLHAVTGRVIMMMGAVPPYPHVRDVPQPPTGHPRGSFPQPIQPIRFDYCG